MKTLLALLMVASTSLSLAADYVAIVPDRAESAQLERIAIAHGTRLAFEVAGNQPLVTLRFTYHKGASGRRKERAVIAREVPGLVLANGELYFGDAHCGSLIGGRIQENGNCELVALKDFRPFGTDRWTVVLRVQ